MPTFTIDAKFEYKKYKRTGKTVREVLAEEPGYILAASKDKNMVFGQQVRKELDRLAELSEKQNELF